MDIYGTAAAKKNASASRQSMVLAISICQLAGEYNAAINKQDTTDTVLQTSQLWESVSRKQLAEKW